MLTGEGQLEAGGGSGWGAAGGEAAQQKQEQEQRAAHGRGLAGGAAAGAEKQDLSSGYSALPTAPRPRSLPDAADGVWRALTIGIGQLRAWHEGIPHWARPGSWRGHEPATSLPVFKPPLIQPQNLTGFGNSPPAPARGETAAAQPSSIQPCPCLSEPISRRVLGSAHSYLQAQSCPIGMGTRTEQALK